MLEPVHILDLTQQESKPANRVRVCRFNENKRELSYQWGSEEEIMIDEMNHSMIRLQIDDEHYVMYHTDDDYPNITAMMFGIRAHGKCYAYQYESCDVSQDFPQSLRQWWWCDAQQSPAITNGEYIQLDSFDQSLNEWESEQQSRQQQNSINEPEYDMIQFIYKTIGFTRLPVSISQPITDSTIRNRQREEVEERPSLEIFSLPHRLRYPLQINDNSNNEQVREQTVTVTDQEQQLADETRYNFLRDFDHQLMNVAPANTNDILELIRNDMLELFQNNILGDAGISFDLDNETSSFFTSTPIPPLPSAVTTASRRRSQSPPSPISISSTTLLQRERNSDDDEINEFSVRSSNQIPR